MTSLMPIRVQKEAGVTVATESSIKVRFVITARLHPGHLDPSNDGLGFSPCKVSMNQTSVDAQEKYQGMTSVVPHMAQKRSWASALEPNCRNPTRPVHT
jgi:hypothetical protein